MADDTRKAVNSRLRNATKWLAFVGLAIAMVIVLLSVIWMAWVSEPGLGTIVTQHFIGVVGVPFAALLALCVVLFLETRSGAIEFEVLGLKFRGASGPAVLWTFAFLAIVVAIKLLW